MGNNMAMTQILFYCMLIGFQAWAAQEATSTGEETAILIKKGPAGTILPTTLPTQIPDFEIISSHEDIEGDPALGIKPSRENWKTACSEWKQDTRENNKGNHIIAMSCGTPRPESEGNGGGQYTTRSTTNLKMRVRTRDSGKP